MVVVKLLTFGGELTWETFKLFKREARTLEKLEHPADSKVVLTKGENRLEICIPPMGFHIFLLLMVVFAIIWNGFLVNWYSHAIATWGEAGWVAAFFALGHLGVGLWVVLQILYTLLGQVRLQIDQKKISLSYQLLGLSYHRLCSVPRHLIIYQVRANRNFLQKKILKEIQWK